MGTSGGASVRKPVAAMSVRELIATLALIEDELRTGSSSLEKDPGSPGAHARGIEIVEELRRRSGPSGDAGQRLVRTLVEQSWSAEDPVAIDPDAGRVGHGPEGEDLGEGVVRVVRVPQDRVEGRPRRGADPDGVEPVPHG